MLFDPFEEQLDLPAAAIQLGDSQKRTATGVQSLQNATDQQRLYFRENPYFTGPF